ncbi:MAG TPA: hypothetical protein VHU22_12775 [Xanthobacteraceae bacterium]|jgi:hypothetical protein|nr:hypothetical protein [Xanthobacteraceae bacterium]
MNISPTPIVAIGTLSGNLPKNATTAAGPLPGANGAPSSGPVGLSESNALQGVTLTPFKTMQVSGGAILSPSTLAFFQEQFQQQSAAASQANGSTNPTT